MFKYLKAPAFAGEAGLRTFATGLLKSPLKPARLAVLVWGAMKTLNTSLLREKFTIIDPVVKTARGPVVALSNRMVLELRNNRGDLQETMIVRAQNMHVCVRMAARILHSYLNGGPLLDRRVPYDWNTMAEEAAGEYERASNERLWIAVYSKGSAVFKQGSCHPLLGLLEKYAAMKDSYEQAVPLAEAAFQQAGKKVRIDYDGNVALNIDLEKTKGRCGVILRSANQKAIFNFTAGAKAGKTLSFPQILSAAAAFLEGIQLAFHVGMNGEKIKMGMISQGSDEAWKTAEGSKRLLRLSTEIANMEDSCEIRYRPERPEFQRILTEAENMAQWMFKKKR